MRIEDIKIGQRVSYRQLSFEVVSVDKLVGDVRIRGPLESAATYDVHPAKIHRTGDVFSGI